MSGHQSSLLLSKGATGECIYVRSRKWHPVQVYKTVQTLHDIPIQYIKRKTSFGTAHQDMLRCINVGGSENAIYRGMKSMCRNDLVESDDYDCEKVGLSGYGFGTVTAVANNNGDENADDKETQIEFEFAESPSSKIKAKGSDLLYWAIPEDMTEAEATAKMGVDSQQIGPETSNDEEDEEEEVELPLKRRKRQAPTRFDPTSNDVSSRIIQDSSNSSNDDGIEAEATAKMGVDSQQVGPEISKDEEDEEEEVEPPLKRQKRQAPTKFDPSRIIQDSSNSSDDDSIDKELFPGSDSDGEQDTADAAAVTPSSHDTWGGSSSSSGPTGSDSGTHSGWSMSNCTRHNSVLEYRDPVQDNSRRTQSQYATKSEGKLEIYRESDDDSFLRWHFGERVKVHEVGVGKCQSLEKTKYFGDQECTLVASKFEKQEARPSRFHASKFGGSPYVKAFYLVGDSDTVQKELNEIADFAELGLKPGKLASRLELLVSTAACSPNKSKSPYMFELPMSAVEEIDLPENATMGCGFIPSDMLEELLGGGKDAKEAIAVQVRLIIPTMGIFKGELVRRAGIQKIQLPSSMKKVGKSTGKKSFKSAFMLFNSVCPSKNSTMMERQLNPNSKKGPPESAESGLKGMGSMMERMLQGCGVPNDVLQEYLDRSKHYDGRCHAYLTGVSDCTVGGLPPGTVFVTGFGVGSGGAERKIFVTRSPCTEQSDAKLLPVVSEKPDGMSDVDWKHLCSLPFGAIMFSSPSEEESPSLPELTNSSDLDGDLFFVLWEPALLPYLEETLRSDDNQDTASHREGNEDLEAAQEMSEDDDELLGAYVPLSVGGKTCNAIVARKNEEGKYVVQCGEHVEMLSYEDLVAERGMGIIEEVVGHRGKGKNAEVEVLWEGGKRTWQEFAIMKEQAPSAVAVYALENGLLEKRGWMWAKDYIHEADIISVESHRRRGKTLEVEVLYDGDTETTWTTAKDIDVDILASYVEENDISLEGKQWKWLKRSIKKAKKGWFAAVQERTSDVKRMSEYSKFVEALYRGHKKRNDITDESSIWLGRGFKLALDIGKHAGRVPLPRALRSEVFPKGAAYADKFLKDV